jgi:hypothetical protein
MTTVLTLAEEPGELECQIQYIPPVIYDLELGNDENPFKDYQRDAKDITIEINGSFEGNGTAQSPDEPEPSLDAVLAEMRGQRDMLYISEPEPTRMQLITIMYVVKPQMYQRN